MSGTNAHTILEEAPRELEPEGGWVHGEAPEFSVLPFMVSAKRPEALIAQAERLRLHLMAHPELEPLDVAATLALHRAHLPERAAFLAVDREELLAGLRALADGQPSANLARGVAARGGKLVVSASEVASSIRADPSGARELLSSLTEAHVDGVAVDWRPLFPIESCRYTPLPTYAFQRRRYWLTAHVGGVGADFVAQA
jgi:acyl transferase domain-containing protein